MRNTAWAWSIWRAVSSTDSKIVSCALPPLIRLVISWRVAKNSSFSARSVVAGRTISPERFMALHNGATSMPHGARLLILPEQAELREKAPDGEEEDRQNPNRNHDPVGREVLERGSDATEIDEEEHDVEEGDRSGHEERGEPRNPTLGPAESLSGFRARGAGYAWIGHGL